MTTQPTYDLSYLREITNNDNDFIKKMIGIFIQEIPNDFNRLKEFFANKEYQKMGETAHKMKSAIDNMGIISLKNTIREIETSGKNEPNHRTLEQLVSTTENVLSNTITQLKVDFSID